MIARTALVALLLALAIASLAARAEAAEGGHEPKGRTPELSSGDNDVPADRTICRTVKVVYAGHGEAERAPCRPAR